MVRRNLMRFVLLLVAVVAATSALIPAVEAQGNDLDALASPNYGLAILRDAFEPDPHVMRMASGGNLDLAVQMGGQCIGEAAGYGSSAPDYRVKYAGQQTDPLRFFFLGTGDTTLVVRAPDGQWFCDDDSGGDLNPMISLQTPHRGWYNVWVGSYEIGATVNGALYVTHQFVDPSAYAEMGGGGVLVPAGGNLDPSAPPNYQELILTGGFIPDPYAVEVTSGGDVDLAAGLGAICQGEAAGFATTTPDYRVLFNATGATSLRFFFVADGDTTMVVNGPDGQWYCDDDSGGAQNPMITFDGPASGPYSIWVGSFNAGEYVSGMLNITGQGRVPADTVETAPGGEVAPEQSAPVIVSGLEPLAPDANYGTAVLQSGFQPDPYSVRMMSGGAVDLLSSLSAVCQGEAAGFAASAPDFRLEYTAGVSGQLRFFFVGDGDGDTTIAVQGPADVWYCDDDSGGGVDPMVTFVTPLAGQYNVWVGSYAAGDYVGGDLYITEQAITPLNYP